MFGSVAPLILLSLATSTWANLFITSPVQSTTYDAGKPCNVTWIDGGKDKKLSELGKVKITLSVGNGINTAVIQQLVDSVDATALSATININPNVAPESDLYFIQIEPVAAHDSKDISYSAKFNVKGMKGQWPKEAQSLVSSQPQSTPSSPSPPPSGAPGPAPSPTPTNKPNPSSAPPKPVAAAATGSTPSGSSSGAATGASPSWFISLFLATFAVVAMF